MKKMVQGAILQYLTISLCSKECLMKRTALFVACVCALLTSVALAFQAPTDGPYKVLKTARVGGEGGTDYIFADPVGRRLYITRGATQAQPATETTPPVPAFEKRLTILDLDTLLLPARFLVLVATARPCARTPWVTAVCLRSWNLA